MSSAVEFHFEFASPYAYLAHRRIEEIALRHGREVDWRPIMLGAAFKLTGARPTVEIPLKGSYFRRDVQRFARFLKVPLHLPDSMPMNSLAASRAFWWLHDREPFLARELGRAVLVTHWGEGRDLAAPEAVAAVAVGLGVDREELIAAVADPLVKERLKNETQRSIDKGVFGSPFFIVDGEPFWGADRLDMVEAWLGGGW
jgi:2-hydroxychromene-2-carboxylate isomerase